MRASSAVAIGHGVSFIHPDKAIRALRPLAAALIFRVTHFNKRPGSRGEAAPLSQPSLPSLLVELAW